MDLGSFPEEVGNYFTRIVRDMVKYREENNIIRGDFLDILIAMKNHDESKRLKSSHNDVGECYFKWTVKQNGYFLQLIFHVQK